MLALFLEAYRCTLPCVYIVRDFYREKIRVFIAG